MFLISKSMTEGLWSPGRSIGRGSLVIGKREKTAMLMLLVSFYSYKPGLLSVFPEIPDFNINVKSHAEVSCRCIKV